MIDPSDDSDWEDMDDTEEKETKHYNTMSLQYFARECDRAGAKIGNGLLKDMGVVNKHNKDKLICPTKLRRLRKRWGAK